MNKICEELYVDAPWGKIALVIWGDRSLEPVLMMHGRLDSAATFLPLVRCLPPTHCYYGVDLPGNGKSDPYPKGLAANRYSLIAVIDFVVRHMKWKSFIYMGHSMGCEIGLFYNAIWPGLITKFIHLDARPSFQRLQQPNHPHYYIYYYEKFYGNYHRYNYSKPKQYTKKQALTALMKARLVNEEQAEILLSRALVPIGEDKYILSWDPKNRYVAPQNTTNDYYKQLFTVNRVPTILVTMSEGSHGVDAGLKGAMELVQMLVKEGNVQEIHLEGTHDHHVTNPDIIAKYIIEFLNKNIVKSKF